MQYVQLVVPKHLYDQLGLQPNQTITLHNSQSASELKTHESNASTSNSSDDHKPLLAKPGTDGKTVDGEANESSLKKPAGTFQVIHVNSGNTPRPETTAMLSNSQSSGEVYTSEDDSESSDGDVSMGEMPAEDCDTPIFGKPEISRVDVNETDQHSFGDHPAPQKMTINGLEREVISFPRRCEKCSRTYSCHASFGFHKKTCGMESKIPFCQPTRKNISYPRVCPTCNRCYSNRSSFAHHHRLCKEFKRKQACHNLLNIVQPLSSPNSRELSIGRINGSTSNNSGNSDASAKESRDLNAEDKPEKWIPVTNNRVHMKKFFVVKNT